jgi:uncharacterized protein YjbI with pentapeptide repeats
VQGGCEVISPPVPIVASHLLSPPGLDGPLIASLTAVVTALVAIGGLIFSFRTAADVRTRETEQAALRQFQETSANLSSDSPALRSVGVEHMARYLNQSAFSETALRVLVYDYLLERDLHLRSRIGDLLVSHARSAPELLAALARMNRETWRLIVSASTSGAEHDEENRLDRLVATLELTKQAIAAVLRKRLVEAEEPRPSRAAVDLSGTRLDGADLSGATLVGTSLRWASLSFCNLYGAQLMNCDMSFAVFVGAYLEKARIAPSSADHAVFLRAGFKDTKLTLPETEGTALYFSSHEGLSFSDSDQWTPDVVRKHLRSFKDQSIFVCLEHELTWPGLWVSSPDGDLTAIWESEVDGRTVSATMQLQDGSSLRRTASSDSNDGEYHIHRRFPLDPIGRYVLVTGSRSLRGGRERAWYGIWWRFASSRARRGRKRRVRLPWRNC